MDILQVPSRNPMEIEPVVNETGQFGVEKQSSKMTVSATSSHFPGKQSGAQFPEGRVTR